MSGDRAPCVLVMDDTQPAFQTAARWLTVIVSVGLAACLLAIGSIYVLCRRYPDLTADLNLRALPRACGIIVVTWAIAMGGLRLGARYLRRTRHMVIGADFLIGPGLFFFGMTEIESTPVRFRDIRSVRLDILKGRITGAVIRAKPVSVSLRKMKEVETIVRTIFERTGPEVKWRRSAGLWRPRLSRDQVQELIEESGGKDISARLPPDSRCVTADEFLDRSEPQELVQYNLEPPTPAERYAGLLLLEMCRDGRDTRILSRSKPLAPIVLKQETLEPPPLAEVVDRLKNKCGLKPKTYRKPVAGTIHLTTHADKLGPRQFQFTCHFDDSSEACCTIRMVTEEDCGSTS